MLNGITTKKEMLARISLLSNEIDANEEENRCMQDEIDTLYSLIEAMPIAIRHVTKPGRCASAMERGAGVIVHAVASDTTVDRSRAPALCGAKPTGRLGWTDHCGGEGIALLEGLPEINCQKCLEALSISRLK